MEFQHNIEVKPIYQPTQGPAQLKYSSASKPNIGPVRPFNAKQIREKIKSAPKSKYGKKYHRNQKS